MLLISRHKISIIIPLFHGNLIKDQVIGIDQYLPRRLGKYLNTKLDNGLTVAESSFLLNSAETITLVSITV
jgi:hypothetical protein